MHFLHIKNVQKYSSCRWQLGRCSWGTLLQLLITEIRLQKKIYLLILANIMLKKIHVALAIVNFSTYWHESLLWHSLWFVGKKHLLPGNLIGVVLISLIIDLKSSFLYVAKPFWLPHGKIVRFMDDGSAITFSFKSYTS